MLGWTADDLATRARISASDVTNFEDGAFPGTEIVERVAAAIEAAGIVLLAEDEGMGAGLRFRRPSGQPDEGLKPEELNSANDG
ncbi:hypothetical protein [Methylobrevis pamukkalensis]|nr:hypothetical protein [Methylobrevis pamukkalensis]